jgi:hypothetical protein
MICVEGSQFSGAVRQRFAYIFAGNCRHVPTSSHLRLLPVPVTKDGCILLSAILGPASMALAAPDSATLRRGYHNVLAFGVLGGASGIWIVNEYVAVVKAEWIDLPGLLGHRTSCNS